MEYTQENIERIKPLFPNNFIRDVTNTLSTSRNRVPYSTVYDTLTRFRSGKQKAQTGKKKPFDKERCWSKAIQMLKEKGILN